MEREFLLLKPECTKSTLSDKWTEMLQKLDKIFGIEEVSSVT